MFHLLALVVSIGLADGMNPTSIGPSLYLASGRNPRRSVLEFAAGYFVVMLVTGLVLTLGPGQAILALVPRPTLTTRYILEVLAGIAMLVTGLVLWRRRRRLAAREKKAESRRTGRSPATMGAAISAVELPTAFPYFAAIAAVVGSGLSTISQILLIAIYDFCFILPVLAIVVMLAVAGERAVDLLTRVRTYMRAHWPVIVAVIALVAGGFVTTLGATGLASRGRPHSFPHRLHHLLTHGSLGG